jgi:alanine racemase
VLTPHAGELARLLELDSAEVGARRLHHVRDAARRSQAVVLLKGDDTLVATPQGEVGVSRGGSGALATAGTGAVLSGVIGARLAKRLHPFRAACAGTWLHATAGQVAAERFGADVVIARDVIDALEPAGAGETLIAVLSPHPAVRGFEVAWLRAARGRPREPRRGSATCARLAGALTGGASCAPWSSRRLRARRRAARPRRCRAERWLAVATAGEARALARGRDRGPLLIMGALTPAEIDIAAAADADVTTWDERFVAALAGRPLRVHVKLDSGMGRLGTRDVEAARRVVAAVDAAPGLTLAGVMTHFATADEVGDAFLTSSWRPSPFAAEVKRSHPGAIAHAANSAATLREAATHFDLVRCGVAVYGPRPVPAQPGRAGPGAGPGLQPSYVAAVKPAAPGQSVGYGRRFVATEPTTLATIPIGYGDDARRALTNNADVILRGAAILSSEP